MNFEVLKIQKDKRNIEFELLDKNNNEKIKIEFKKIFIPEKDLKNETEIREKYKGYNQSEFLSETTIAKGLLLRINNVPLDLQTEEFYTFLIENYADVIDFIEVKDRTYNMCKIAIICNPLLLKYIPEEHRDYELIVLALSQNGVVLQYIKPENRTEEFCSIAFESNSRSLRVIPEIYITYEMCVKAVIDNMYSIHYVPKKWLLNVYKEAIVNRNLAFPQLKKNRKNYSEVVQYDNIIQEIKVLLQRNTSMVYGMLDPNLSLAETAEEVKKLEQLILERKMHIESIQHIDQELNNISAGKKL